MKKKLTPRQWCRIGCGISGLGFVPILVGGALSRSLEPHPLLWVGVVLFLAGVVFNVLKVRCPECGCYLAFQVKRMPEYCPKCGAKLDEDEQ